MRGDFCSCAAIAAVLAVPAVCHGQDAVTGLSVGTYPNFETMGIEVAISGDADRDATASLAYSVGMGPERMAHPLFRVDDTHFSGTLFWLPGGAPINVRVTLDDPDGVTAGTLTATGQTRTPGPPASAADAWHVAEDGSDDTGTGSEANPFASISRALEEAGAGDEILVHAGTYHESVELTQGGAPDAPLVIRAAGDGPAVLDGSDPALLEAAAWTNEGGGLWSAAAAETRYVSIDGVRMWDHEDTASLAAAGAMGFAWDTRVYVKLPPGHGPADHDIRVSAMGRAFWLEGAPWVVIRDLVIRNYGAEEYSEGIMVRDGSHGVWIVGCTFLNVMPGIWVKNDVDDLTVTGCTFSDVGLADFDWAEVKARGGMESGALSLDEAYDGRGIVFADNVVHDSFDGLHACGDEVLSHPIHLDVIRNSFAHLGDDGIEADGVCPDVRIVQNRFEDMLVGVSTAPAVTGPVWIVRNLMVHHRNVAAGSDWMSRPLKCNVGDSRPSGVILLYHNTGFAGETGQQGFTITDDSRWEMLVDVNNIWVGTEHAYYYANDPDDPLTFDHDLLFTSGPDGLAYFQGDHLDTLSDITSVTGHMAHGLAGDPLFVDPSAGDFTPGEGSPAIDSALPLAGINDDHAGDGPDRGAIEAGMTVPPDPLPELAPDTAEPWPDASTDATWDPATDVPTDTAGQTGEARGCGCSLVR